MVFCINVELKMLGKYWDLICSNLFWILGVKGIYIYKNEII